MKAKIIKNGEIVEVYHETQHGQTTNIYKESVLVNGRMWTEDELDFSINSKSKEVDLDEEADNLWGALSSDVRNSIYYNDYYKIAKHFFELGLKNTKGE